MSKHNVSGIIYSIHSLNLLNQCIHDTKKIQCIKIHIRNKLETFLMKTAMVTIYWGETQPISIK